MWFSGKKLVRFMLTTQDASARDNTGRADDTAETLTVWILVTALSVGGAERTIVDLANGVDHDRFEVVVWTIFDTNPLAERLDGVTVRTLNVRATHGDDPYEITGAVNPLMYVLAPLKFVFLVWSVKPDILHSFLLYDNLIARVAGLITPQTTVVTGERGFHNSMGRVLGTLDRATVSLSDLIVSNSKAGADYYADQGVARDDLRVIPNGRDLAAYRGASGDGIRVEFDVSSTASVVGTVGRLVKRKGHFDLLRAWPAIRKADPDAHLLIVGYGPERDALERLAADFGVADSIHFAGARDDVPELLNAMDIFVFPSHWEGLPGALQEAMAAGLPIVATRVTGTAELVSDGETGLLVPPEDPNALASATAQLLTDRTLARSLGDRAQTEAFEVYTLDRMVNKFEDLYDELAT